MWRKWMTISLLLIIVILIVFLGHSLYLGISLKDNYHNILTGNTYGIYNAMIQQFQWASHDFHPSRGWTPKRNVAGADNGRTWTNDRGYRSRNPYVFQPDKYTVLVLGDSFTFGDEVANEDAWPEIMGTAEDRLHVINLGVSGYGIDQMLITERETISDYNPQLVILAFISPDLDRAMWSYFAAAKPRFTLNPDGSLLLTNVPLDDPITTAARLKEHYSSRLGPFRFLFREYLEDIQELLPRYERDRDKLATRIIEQAEECARASHGDFLLVQLHCTQGEDFDIGLEFLARFEEEHPRTNCLQTKKAFKESSPTWPSGHYRRAGAELAANVVLNKIHTLESWREFESKGNRH